ncbi:MAG: hypothetical protein P1P90_00040 [Patescibacteria group bacterium]|nr:hypothetical protein [Patescibacteria group bacterium]
MPNLFYIPIYPVGEGTKQNTFGILYGPFDDPVSMKQDMRERFRSASDTAFLIINGCVSIMEPNPKEMPASKKRNPGNNQHYIGSNGKMVCRDCGEETSLAHIPFPVDVSGWRTDRPGCNTCGYQEMRYCPNCERRPTYRDLPGYKECK